MEVTALSSISRTTLADGQWINDSIIKVADDDIKAIASSLDENGIDELNGIRSSAMSGQLAHEKVKDYSFLWLYDNSQSGRVAWQTMSSFPFDKAIASAKSGAAAAAKILPYDVKTISANINSGKAAWDAAKGFDLAAILASAKDSRAAYNILSANNQTIKDIITTYESTIANATYNTAASAAVKKGQPVWNTLKDTIAASAGQWNKLSAYYNNTKRDYLNRSYDWVSANSAAVGTLEQNISGIANWNRAYNTVCADSGISAWNRTYSAVMSASGYPEWNKLPGNTADFVKVSAVSANSATWGKLTDTVNASASKFNDTYNTTTANRNSWITYNKIYEPYIRVFTNFQNASGNWQTTFYGASTSISGMSGKYNLMTKSANTYSTDWDKTTGFESKITNWDRVYNTVNSKSAKWDHVYDGHLATCAAACVFSSHSGTRTTPKWEQMAYQKGDWWYGTIGSWTGVYCNYSAGFIKQLPAYSAEINSARAPFSSAVNIGTKNYSGWYQLNNYYGTLPDYLNKWYSATTANSAKWVIRPNTSNSLHILRRKGWFSKKLIGSHDISETIFLIS